MAGLFDDLQLRSVTLPNRIAVSPMCQYSCTGGVANDWHFVHLATRAVGGAGLVFTEATAVTPDGRISPEDLGIWDDAHVAPLARITKFIDAQGGVAGIQLAHAGRKASTWRPWSGHGTIDEASGGWSRVLAPSAVRYSDGYPLPQEMTEADIAATVRAFAAATVRSLEAGFRVVELHAAHGYLLHEFLSPLSNRRTDRWGGSFENRTRLIREVVEAIRRVWADELPLVVRISATDWTDGGWDIEQSVALVRALYPLGVDLVDVSSGGNVAHVRIATGPGFQTAFAERIRRETGVPTGTVGEISEPAQADHVIRTGQADLVLLARELLRDPYWPLRAARELGQSVAWPAQYLRAAPAGTAAREDGGAATSP